MAYIKNRSNYRTSALSKLHATCYEQQADGEVLASVKDLTLEENQKQLPTREEMSIDNLQRAGVPLNFVPCTDLLNPSDPANRKAVAESVVSNLENFELTNED